MNHKCINNQWGNPQLMKKMLMLMSKLMSMVSVNNH